MSWHAADAALDTYSRGDCGGAQAVSIEAHLMNCHECRCRVARLADRPHLDEVWRKIAGELDAPVPGLVERGLLRVGVSDHVARLLAATPSLRLSWFLAVGVALAFAVAAAHADPRGILLFLVGAPMIPLAGVAAAYGPRVDPTFEIGLAAPMRSFRLLLIRSAAVLVSSATFAAIAAFFLPDLNVAVVAWLLPSLALSSSSLALSTRMPPLAAAATIGVVWVVAVGLIAFEARDAIVPFGAPMQLASLVVAGASMWTLSHTRESFEQKGAA